VRLERLVDDGRLVPHMVAQDRGQRSAVADLTVRPFPEAFDSAMGLAWTTLAWCVAPLLALIAAIGVMAGMAGTLGPLFSFAQLAPNLEHLNPIQGLKRIVSLRNLIEIAKSFGKIAILVAVFAAILPSWLQPLFEMPACGESCVAPVLVAILKPVMLAAALVFLTLGIVDVALQYRLLLRDMRMTRTEQKREHKDNEGDPLLRGERRRLFAEMLQQAASFGIRKASIAVVDGDRIVGLRYVRGETALPMVVAKARGAAGFRMIERARRDGTPVVHDRELAAALASRHALGKPVARDLFRPVALLLVRERLL
jgi:type III secretion protein U